MKWIKLTRATTETNGKDLLRYVNAEHIAALRPNGRFTYVIFANGQDLFVEESIEVVMKAIKGLGPAA